MLCTNPFILTKNLDQRKYPDGLKLPCGKCLACRIAIRKQWSLRNYHELESHDNTSFVTLTYDDENIPDNYSVSKMELTNFIRRLKRRAKEEGKKIKYFASAEYGEQTARPHYHLILYNVGLDIEDKLMVMDSWDKCDWDALNWNGKNSPFGMVEPESIEYVAGYVNKKYYGEEEYIAYKQYGLETPFKLQSNGLGKEWCIKNKKQIIDNGFVWFGNNKMAIPRQYVTWILKDNYQEDIKIMTKEQANERYIITQEIIKEKMTNYAIDEEKRINEQKYGIENTDIELYKVLDKEEYMKGYNKIQSSKKQYDLNLKKRQSIAQGNKI
jgi:hypothetical protein